MTGTAGNRTLLVDASVCITLAEIGEFGLLDGLSGDVVVPAAVREEVTDDPARTDLDAAIDAGWITVDEPDVTAVRRAAVQLGTDAAVGPDAGVANADAGVAGDSDVADADGVADPGGDVALLAVALERDRAVVVTDDRPLRETCKALSIPVSGSLGALVRAVERGDLPPEDARDRLYAMDEVGARLSASLVRRAERLIDRAVDDAE